MAFVLYHDALDRSPWFDNENVKGRGQDPVFFMSHVLAQWGTQLRLYPQTTLLFQWKLKPLHSASFLIVKQAQNWQEMIEDKGKNSPLILLLSIGIGRQYTSSVTDIKPSLDLEKYFPCTYCTCLPLEYSSMHPFCLYPLLPP